MDDTNNNPTPKKKTGNKPKQLVEGKYLGIEVGRGENKKIIDPKEVEKLASIGMKISEMAEWFGVDDSTLNYNFKQNILKGKHNLTTSLRQAQIRLSLSGNATMLICLGRNILGQSESPKDSEGNAPLPWNDEE
jgi:hypothetical protein